ncbi:hypothetical protein HYY70_02795 [Candidatus Woesearchaeota archaeon]|nr:hypothetical protein [Candidatus Woesearchaeota archaeon]
MEFDRRDFLKLSTYGMGSFLVLSPSYEASATQIVTIHTVPNTVRPVNIEQVVNALTFRMPVGRGSYITYFIDLIQYNHQKLTGMTYAEHMNKNFSNRNPIDVLIVDGFMRETGFGGQFTHMEKPGERNFAKIDSGSSPARFLHFLNHELIHAVEGTKEIIAFAHTHRDIAYMVAHFPQLLRENDAECPLADLMNFYVNSFVDKGVPPLRKDNVMAYLQFLNSRLGTGERVNPEIATKTLTNRSIDSDKLYTQLLNRAQYLHKAHGNEYLRYLAGIFADSTEQYILMQNPSISPDKRKLLSRKMQKIKGLLGAKN